MKFYYSFTANWNWHFTSICRMNEIQKSVQQFVTFYLIQLNFKLIENLLNSIINEYNTIEPFLLNTRIFYNVEYYVTDR